MSAPGLGHNNPPVDPFDAIKAKIDDLFMEANNFLDGEEVSTPAMAECIATLLNNIREAEKEADELRIEENKPFDEGKAAVQAKYAPLIANTKSVRGKTVLATEACKNALAPYQAKLKAAQEAAAAEARRVAEEARRQAEEAAEAALLSESLEAATAAQEAAEIARKAEIGAQSKENATPKIANRGGRAISLRTYYVPTLIDPVAAMEHYWLNPMFNSVLLQLAKDEIAGGARSIPGFEITEEQRAA